jgi:transcriptional regulator with XRE-family HTH domain
MEKSTIHHGRNIRRFRDMLQIKQEALAAKLGEDWNQYKISRLEGKDEIDDPTLNEVATALGIPVEAIKNFDETAAISIVANTFTADSAAYVENFKCTFNPLDKVVELYERMIRERDDQIAELLSKKK